MTNVAVVFLTARHFLARLHDAAAARQEESHGH